MDIEEYIGRKHYYVRKHHGHHHDGDHEYNDARYYGRHWDREVLFRIFDRIKYDRRLKLLLLIAAFLTVALIIGLILILLPLLMKIINYISNSGLQGIIDAINGFIETMFDGKSDGPKAIF